MKAVALLDIQHKFEDKFTWFSNKYKYFLLIMNIDTTLTKLFFVLSKLFIYEGLTI